MKRFLLFMTLALVTGFMAFKTISNAIPIGADLPKADVKLKDVSGKEITLKSTMMENGLLVMFSCNTCPWVIKNQQATREACAYALEKKIGVVLLNSNEGQRNDEDSYSEMQQYAKDQGFKWYYAVDRDHVLADAFEANRTPECFLFNKQGKLVYHGAINDNPGSPTDARKIYVKDAVNEMLAGKDVAVKETRSVGCTIKRIE